jgi:hypothetical protein
MAPLLPTSSWWSIVNLPAIEERIMKRLEQTGWCCICIYIWRDTKTAILFFFLFLEKECRCPKRRKHRCSSFYFCSFFWEKNADVLYSINVKSWGAFLCQTKRFKRERSACLAFFFSKKEPKN